MIRRLSFPRDLTRTADRRPTKAAYALPTAFTAGNNRARLASPSDQGLQLERALDPVREDDGAALGVENADGVIEDR